MRTQHFFPISFLVVSTLFFAGCTLSSRQTAISTTNSTNTNSPVTNINIAGAVNSTVNVGIENMNTAAHPEAQNNNIVADNFISFVSQNTTLKFLYNPDWKCVETISFDFIYCYPLTRVSEEHDYGTGQKTVYMPNVQIFNKDCQSTVDQNTVSTSPIKIEQTDSPVFYKFYNTYNGCAVTITTQQSIDSNEKLNAIIHE